MLAGNWKCNYNLEKGKFHCALQNDANSCHLHVVLPTKEKDRIPLPMYFHVSHLVHPQTCKIREEREMSFE